MVELSPERKGHRTAQRRQGRLRRALRHRRDRRTDTNTKLYFNDDNDNDLRVLER